MIPAFTFVQDVTRPVFDFAKTDLFNKLEKWLILTYLVLFSRGIVTLVMTGGASEGGGGGEFDYGFLTLLWLLNYLITACLCVLKWDAIKDRLLAIISSNYFYWVFLMFIGLSTIWSEKPDETVKATIGMGGTVLFGSYIVCRYSIKEQFNLLVTFFSIVLVSSLFFMLIPGYGIDFAKHAGAFRGIYSHKNIFGPIMSMGTFTFLIYSKTNFCVNKKLAYLGFAASFFMVVGSRSSSSLLYTLLLIFLVHAIQVLRLRGQLFAWSLMALASLYFFITTWQETIKVTVLNWLGKDPTLTGRTDIWDVILDKIQERLWLGYGFDGFWHGIYGESFYVRNAVRWDLPNAHNGYLDLALEIGIVGVALLMLVMWISFVKGLAILKNDFSWPQVWPLVFIFYTLMINMSESSLANQNSFQTIMMTIAFTSVSLEFNKYFKATAALPDDLPSAQGELVQRQL
ncbi:O-antigen ligase family protein [Leptolyngbya iicbica]|uniref:O-antigen ligase family protein n=2 Tax=Cyanophyceae TaxID=3028117 RepID=A0A4Q7E9P6_9CYAN|nr:O-antigen ligase family protein [Leptolyngbya sp. LK]RZM79587.1 O-antigen ligase family protein [Leptolyngbya sp. LK]